MCGITGYFSLNNSFNPQKFAKANNIIRHRGPDDFGYLCIQENFDYISYKDENLTDYRSGNKAILGGVGFRRLSIIDLSKNGHQPFVDEVNRLGIIFNGEIYNYIELREELRGKGYVFRSNTDTEVIIKAYKEWGNNCLKRFNGMWAFCIIDFQNKELFCSRDRLGIKPFYYFLDGAHFIFGSEIKQIFSLLPVKVEENGGVLLDYLYGSYGNETEESFINKILKLPAGHFATISFSKVGIGFKLTKFWDLPIEDDQFSDGYEENGAIEKLLDVFEDSVRLRLRSDVPLGTCLSGGLDSSGIALMVKRIMPDHPHKVFTIQSIDKLYDETRYAKVIIDKTQFDAYYKKPATIDFENDFRKFIWHQDEPLIKASMFGGYEVYRLAKENGVTVVLDGQGADELLGGYYSGVQYVYLLELLKQNKLNYLLNQAKANSILYNISLISIIKTIILKWVKTTIKENNTNLTEHNRTNNIYKVLTPLINEDFIRENIGKSNLLEKKYDKSRKFKSDFKKESYFLTKHTNLPGILRQVDRNSMAFSVEARVPFLDYRLVEFFYKLPTKAIMRNGYTKYLYRESMKGIMPEEVRTRTDKIGFEMPERLWLINSKEKIEQFLNECNANNIFNVKIIRSEFSKRISNTENYNSIIWRVINAMVWQNIFLNN